MPASLVLAGCGKMGGALLAGWLDRGLEAADVDVVEPDAAAADAVRERHGVAVHPSPDAIAETARPDVVVLAVKPQVMDDALPGYRRFARPGTVFLSIAAGRTVASLAAGLGEGATIVRAMPNTPAAVRRGITVACAGAGVSPDQRAACDGLLAAVGEVAWVDDEGLMDAVTAVSGSGPAYVFHLVECLAEAGRADGLPADLAERLARATVAGAGRLLETSGEPAARLRRDVTSPGGTTAAALEVLMAEGGLQPLMTAVVAAATRRSRELAGA